VDFRNTVLIMTSNIGADLIKGGGGFGFQKRTEGSNFDNNKSVLMKEIERFFRPEFINRLDDVVVFRPLTKDNLINIVDLEAAKVTQRVAQQGVTLVLDQKAKDFLIDKGYNPDFGARPLRRAVGQFLEDPLSEMLLLGTMKPGQTVTVTRRADAEGKDEDHLYFDVTGEARPEPVRLPPGGEGTSSTSGTTMPASIAGSGPSGGSGGSMGAQST
jgi:ATP-dependent Clp protease ATP-binding subunit ClpC